jgi:hypothetical protein
MNNIFDNAIKDLGNLTPVHDFKAQPQVIGVYTKVTLDVGEHKTPMYEFEQPDGTKFALWGSYQIHQFMQKHKVGDKVGFEFKGVTDLEDGTTVKSYDCYSF